MQLGQECRAKAVHVILGPTVNIHRNPLGGRGFEMFSEDPFLSGKVAAQYVRGVQEQGVAATMKHFVGQGLHQDLMSFPTDKITQAGNEQEFERMKANSIISERALREIYLEPFRLAVKEAQPRCFM